jgi:hypothetical protein
MKTISTHQVFDEFTLHNLSGFARKSTVKKYFALKIRRRIRVDPWPGGYRVHVDRCINDLPGPILICLQSRLTQDLRKRDLLPNVTCGCALQYIGHQKYFLCLDIAGFQHAHVLVCLSCVNSLSGGHTVKGYGHLPHDTSLRERVENVLFLEASLEVTTAHALSTTNNDR